MKKEKFGVILAMSQSDLQQSILQERKRLFAMSFDRQADGFKSDQMRKARKAIARYKTALGQNHSRQGGAR